MQTLNLESTIKKKQGIKKSEFSTTFHLWD